MNELHPYYTFAHSTGGTYSAAPSFRRSVAPSLGSAFAAFAPLPNGCRARTVGLRLPDEPPVVDVADSHIIQILSAAGPP
jgi:hypothetical protein